MIAKPILCPDCSRSFAQPADLSTHRRATHDNPHWIAQESVKRRRIVPTCPKCGRQAQVTATRYGARSRCCDLWSWNFRPLVDESTHRARNAAHIAFDPLWKDGKMSRGEAYRRLQIALKMSSDVCHISIMGVKDAERVIAAVRAGALEIPEFEKEAAQ